MNITDVIIVVAIFLQINAFHSLVQANQSEPDPLSLLASRGMTTMIRRAAVKFKAPHSGQHFRVYAVGLAACLTCLEAMASIRCGAAISIATAESIVGGTNTVTGAHWNQTSS